MNSTETAGKFTYQRVADAILSMCRKGEVVTGSRLPSAHELANRFGCNYHTVRKGIEQLESAGIIESKPGAGCFIKNSSRTLPMPDRGETDRIVTAVCRPPNSSNDMRCISSLHNKCEEQGYHFELLTVSNFQNPQALLDRIILRGCGKLLFPMLRADDNIPAIGAALKNCRIPVVVGSPLPGLEQYCYESPAVFGLSNYLSIMNEFFYFKALGFERIALLLSGMHVFNTVSDVIQSYADSCIRTGIRPEIKQVCGEDGAFERMIEEWTPCRGKIAVIVYSEEMTIKLALAARSRNWKIPQDIAMIGWGDTGLGMEFETPISSMNFPFDYLAEALLKKTMLPPGKFVREKDPIQHEFILRSSCGGIARLGKNKALKLFHGIGEKLNREILPDLLKQRKRTIK